MIRQTLIAATAASALVVVPAGPFSSPARAASPAAGATLQGTVSYPKGSADLFVYVTTAPGTFAPPATHPVMDQKSMKFNPHVMPVLVGTTVDFLNSDSVSHNVFSPDQEGYNLGTWPKGAKRSYVFKHPRVYTQLCSIHPEMEAFVIVLQNPYYATTDADGHFNIEGLPAGHYELKVWGEHMKSKDLKKTFPVDVAATGSTTTLTFGSTTTTGF
jgi:plastocyanin